MMKDLANLPCAREEIPVAVVFKAPPMSVCSKICLCWTLTWLEPILAESSHLTRFPSSSMERTHFRKVLVTGCIWRLGSEKIEILRKKEKCCRYRYP
jgi:hypothetical protein